RVGGSMMNVSVDFNRAADVLGLEHTLDAVPPHSMVRGAFFRIVDDALSQRGLVLPSVGLAGMRLRLDHRLYLLYPTRDLMAALATAGAMLDRDPREGMRKIFAHAPYHFSNTLFGRAFARFFNPDPVAPLSWIERSRDIFCNYGTWRVEVRSSNHVT